MLRSYGDRGFSGGRLGWVDHAAGGLVGLLDTGGGPGAGGLAGLDLLVRLDEGAEDAAAGESDIGDAVALEVVLGTSVGALNRHGHPVEAAPTGGAEEEALTREKGVCQSRAVARYIHGQAKGFAGDLRWC